MFEANIPEYKPGTACYRIKITFQQVQKYERGAGRVSTSHLWDISQILDVSMSYFFDGMSQNLMKSLPLRVSCCAETLNDHCDQLRGPMARREALGLVWTYHTTEKPVVRKRISEMVKSIATTLLGE